MEGTADRQTWKIGHTLGTIGMVAGIIVVGLLSDPISALFSWLIILALLTGFVVVAGHGVTGLALGCFIDGRNRMSLARLQTILWTVVVLSAFLAAALIRISREDVSDPLSIGIPEQLWVVMGISITSLVGSPLILSTKKTKNPQEQELRTTLVNLEKQGEGTSDGGVTHVGQVITKTDPAKASVSDLFRGDETSDAAQLDLGKIQMFYFTLALVIAYGVQLGSLFQGGDQLGALPELSSGVVALLGISHAGYLANKATPSVGAAPS